MPGNDATAVIHEVEARIERWQEDPQCVLTFD
jgi:hypothetical protein